MSVTEKPEPRKPGNANNRLPPDPEPPVSPTTVIESNIDVVTSDALSGLTRAEIDIQIATAKRYPRSLKTFLTRAVTMATLDTETAASCIYSLPRDGKPVTGPSVRLAEIVASAWGNLRMAARLVAEEPRFITAQGLCHDLEANNAIAIDVQRRITRKNGTRFGDDMIVVTGNAAASIALRNAILRIIPRAYVNQIYGEARKVAIGDAKTITQRRADLIAYFGKMGITPERICAAVERGAVEDIDQEDLLALRGYANTIKDGQANIDEVFPEPKGKPEPKKPGMAPDPKPEPSPVTPSKAQAGEPPSPAERQAGDDDPDAEGPPPGLQDATKQLLEDWQAKVRHTAPSDFAKLRAEILAADIPQVWKQSLLHDCDRREGTKPKRTI